MFARKPAVVLRRVQAVDHSKLLTFDSKACLSMLRRDRCELDDGIFTEPFITSGGKGDVGSGGGLFEK